MAQFRAVYKHPKSRQGRQRKHKVDVRLMRASRKLRAGCPRIANPGNGLQAHDARK